MLANEKCSHHKPPCPPRPPCPPCPPPCPPCPDSWEEFCKACHKYCDKNHCEPPCKEHPCHHGDSPSWKPGDAPQAGCGSCWAYGQNGRQEGKNDYGQEAVRDYGQEAVRNYGQEAVRDYGQEAVRDYGREGIIDRVQDTTRKYGREAIRDYGQETVRGYRQEQAVEPRQIAGGGYAASREYGQEMTRDVSQVNSEAAPQNAPVQTGNAVNWAYTQDGIWVYYPRSVWPA